jgi:hypothetical protein
MFRLVARIGAIALAMLTVIGVRPSFAATFEISEHILSGSGCSPLFSPCGEYTLTNNSTDTTVFGFIVSNSFTTEAAVIGDLSQWSAAVINEATWNAGGVQLTMTNTSGPDTTLLDSSSLLSWDTYFGSDTAANAYWVDVVGPPGVLPGEADLGGFLWQEAVAASNFIVLGSGTNNILATGSIGAVPVPASLPLFVSGLGALGFFGWRKRRASAA